MVTSLHKGEGGIIRNAAYIGVTSEPPKRQYTGICLIYHQSALVRLLIPVSTPGKVTTPVSIDFSRPSIVPYIELTS